jgi:O-antigen/teichoic acid export membrane protein
MKDVLFTGVTSVITLAALVLFTRFLATGLGPAQFGAYALARRFWSILASLTTVLGLALTRQIAVSREPSERQAYLLAGSISAIAIAVAGVALGLVFRHPLTALVFHDPRQTPLLLATLVLFAGNCAYCVLYALYRGSRNMTRANWWNLAVVAIGPTFIAWYYAPSGRIELILLLSAALLGITIIPLAFQLARAVSRRHASAVADHLRELARYGVPRIPVGFGFASMLAFAPLMAAHRGWVEGAGYLVTAQALVTMAQSGTEAFSLVALPKVAELVSVDNQEFLAERISDIAIFAVHLGVFAALQLMLWADVLVLGWLGPQYAPAIPIVRITLLAILPFLGYSMLRTIIDGVEVRAVNTLNVSVALAVTAGGCWAATHLGFGLNGLAVGTTLGFYTLGLLTVRYLWRRFRLTFSGLLLPHTLVLNALLIAAGFAASRHMVAVANPQARLGLAALAVAGSAIVYLGALRRLHAGWILELEKRLLHAGAS